jgi:TPR repeat protein
MLATRAEKRGDYAAAFQWLREPLDNDDVDAALRIADLFLEERPGLTKKREDGLKLLSNLADFGIGAASRRLAELSIEGKLVPKDLKNARRVLTASAERSDVESQSMLGYHLLTGTFGKVDEREGQKWLERALAEEDVGAAVTYTQWLFWTKKTPEARKHAIDLWKQSEAWSGGGDTILNNYAWALCTVDDAAWRNGAEGLVAALKMDSTSFGDIDTVAACHAAAGDFASAKVQQQKAIDLYAAYLAQEEKLRAGQALDAELKKGRDAQMDELKSRLTLYAAGKDYRTNEG